MSDHLGLSLDKPVEVIQHWRCIDCQHETITIVTMMALDWVLLCHSDPDRRRVSFIGGFFERHWYEEYVCEDCLQKRSEDAQAQQELLHPLYLSLSRLECA